MKESIRDGEEDKSQEGPQLTRSEMHELAKERVHEIAREFTAGFKFLEDYPKSVTFFGGSQIKEGSLYYESARALSARLVKELGYSVISGGGPGIMEAANRGAYEAGGQSVGLLIRLPKGQPTNKYLTTSISLYYFFVRKVCLSFSAEAFIFYPGGFGTFDEFFEILTLVQTGKIPKTPIICVGSKYWNSLLGFIQERMIGLGTVLESELEHFKITDDMDEIVRMVKEARVNIFMPFNGVGK